MSSRNLCILLLLAALTGTTRAAAPPVSEVEPEKLLPATTQVYVRWDGVKAHRDAYRRSAFGRMLGGEMGHSIRDVWGRLAADLRGRTVGDKLLEGVPPAELRRRNELVSACLDLPPVLAETGFVAGFEARAVPPSGTMLRRLGRMATGRSGGEEFAIPYLQLTAIFPGAKDHPAVIKLLEKLSAFEEEGLIKRAGVGGRSCRVVKGGAAEWGWAWWLEGKHLVIVGTLGDPVPGALRVVHAGAGVTDHSLYKSLEKPCPFEVTTRGFIDGKAIASNLSWLRFIQPTTLAALEEAGLLDVQALRFREGFEGEASRATWEVDFAPRQRGIARFLIKKSINLKDLPPLPADAVRWTAARTNVAAVYDLILTLAAASNGELAGSSMLAGATKAFAEAKKRASKEFDDALGVKFDDVLASLGDTFLTHSSPSDGISTLGQVAAVSVKDERRLTRTLDTMMRKIAAGLGDRGRFRTRSFHGVTIREITERGSPISLAYTIHKGWLMLAVNQQPIQGFILRSKGKLDVWKPDRRTARALARIPADAGLVQVVDPRSTVTFTLSTAPLLAALFSRGRNNRSLDPADLPHAGAVTKHLFPNVSWTSFDGKTFRIESRESLWLPLQEIGPEWLPFIGRF